MLICKMCIKVSVELVSEKKSPHKLESIENQKGLYETVMRTLFVFLWAWNGSDAFCPNLLLHSHDYLTVPSVWILSVLVWKVKIESKKVRSFK